MSCPTNILRFFVASVGVCLLSAACAEGGPLENPCLNPVRPQKAPSHAALKLVVDGEPKFVLVADVRGERRRFPYGWQRGYRSVENAAAAIVKNVKLATGKDVPVLQAGEKVPTGLLAVILGRCEPAEAAGAKADGLPKEGFVVRTFANGIAIVGDDSSLDPAYDPNDEKGKRRGTLWGAYDFIERFFGARFYNPGPDGSVHPPVKDLTVEPFAYADAPAFANRGCYYLRCPEKEASLALGVEIGPDDVNEYHEAMRDAKTEPFTSMHSPHPFPWIKGRPDRQACAFFTSPYGHHYFDPKDDMKCYYDVFGTEFADKLVESFKEFYAAEKPDRASLPYLNRHYVNFGQCDGGVGLADAMHVDVVKREGLITQENIALGYRGFLSDVYGRFYQYVAERLKKELPGKKLVVMPYSQYVYPPTQARFRKLPDNVEAGVCLGEMPMYFPDEARRAEAKRILAGWRETLGGRPAQEIWTYAANQNAFVVDCAAEQMGEMINYFGEDLGRFQVFHELGMLLTPLPDRRYTAVSFPHMTYLCLRAYWNPNFNKDAALDEYWRLYYGPAAKELKLVHRILREAYLRIAVPKRQKDPIYPKKVVDRVEQLLDAAAAKLADGTPERRRCETWTSMLRFEIKRQRKRALENPPYSDERLPDDAVDFEDEAQIAGEMAVQKRHYRGWACQRAIYNRSALLMGDRNCYGLNYLMDRPTDKQPAKTFINLMEPRMRAGFGREPINFFSLTVNDVPLAKTVPGADAFKTSVNDKEATVEMVIDYEGAKMAVVASVKKGSPLLHVTVRHVQGTKRVEGGRLAITCVPSRLHDTDKQGRRPPHAREAITAQGKTSGPREAGAKDVRLDLGPKDRYVIQQDAVFDGSDADKGFGPSYFGLPTDFSDVTSASLKLTTSYDTTLEFALKPGFRELSFTLLQVNERVSNDEFPVRFAELLK